MHAPDTASTDILRRLAYILRGLNDQLAVPSDATLVQLDSEIQEVLRTFRDIADDATSAAPVWSSSESNRLIRAVVVFFSLFRIVTTELTTSKPDAWGAHVFSANDFARIRYEEFDVPSANNARARLLQDQAADLLEAANDLSKMASSAFAPGLLGAIDQEVHKLCPRFGATVGRKLTFTLLSEADALSELGGISAAELARRRGTREVISVPTWLDEIRYPDFQFDRGVVKPALVHAGTNAAPSLGDWSLMIFLFEHQNEGASFFERVLTDRGLWKPEWAKGPSNQFKGKIPPEQRTAPLSRYHRVAREGFSPFFFAAYDAANVRTVGSGRFDLDATSGRGTVYLSESASGAWAEVLDREPVVTLHSLLGRVEWAFAASESLKLADVTTGAVHVSASALRADTQELAARLEPNHSGIRYQLRAAGSDVGVGLFGPGGAVLPGAAGLGAWSAQSQAGVETVGLWDYLDEREKHDTAYPVVLRRFPSEIAIRP